ncbi:MAG: dTDP-4-dehydrorhamnose reductase [Verrucomicrobia bacterium]|nr:dTDP-4-dehydrorhamnose reductase [Verrucomicrobiota bacterium]
MRILMTGAAGMLGSSLYPWFKKTGHTVKATDLAPRDQWQSPLDVRDYDAVRQAIIRFKPQMVFHLAAETDVDRCEREPDHAFMTNALGTQNVALLCGARDLPMVYISTAGVFDGKKETSYTEFDEPRPVIVYGASKLAGEHLVRAHTRRSYIIRAGWMVGGGQKDHKFIGKIIAQIRAGKKQLHCVTDKLGTPTYTEDFARTLEGLVATPFHGLYHMACEGGGTRYDVAAEILRFLGREDIELLPVSSDFWKEQYPAPRPRSEMMENLMLRLRGLNRMRNWRVALHEYLQRHFASEKRK